MTSRDGLTAGAREGIDPFHLVRFVVLFGQGRVRARDRDKVWAKARVRAWAS